MRDPSFKVERIPGQIDRQERQRLRPGGLGVPGKVGIDRFEQIVEIEGRIVPLAIDKERRRPVHTAARSARKIGAHPGGELAGVERGA
jgi:hypothetical protein